MFTQVHTQCNELDHECRSAILHDSGCKYPNSRCTVSQPAEEGDPTEYYRYVWQLV